MNSCLYLADAVDCVAGLGVEALDPVFAPEVRGENDLIFGNQSLVSQTVHDPAVGQEIAGPLVVD